MLIPVAAGGASSGVGVGGSRVGMLATAVGIAGGTEMAVAVAGEVAAAIGAGLLTNPVT